MRGAWVLAVALLAACQRPAPEPRHELAGAWLREPEGTSGFELREDGVLALLGASDRAGLAWNVAKGELMLSTNTEKHPDPNTVHLQIAELGADRLVLEAPDEPFAGTYRRGQVAHVRGVATYREPIALAPGARIELRVARGADPIAAGLVPVRAPIPIPFDISFVPTAGAQYTLSLAILEGDRALFATPTALPVTPDGEPLEVVLEPAR